MFFEIKSVLARVMPLLLLLGGSTSAFADACSSAIARHNAAIKKETTWYAGEIRRVFGVDPKDVDFSKSETCPKALPIVKQRLSMVQEEVQTTAAVYNACSRVGHSRNPNAGRFDSERMTPEQLVAGIQSYIRRCENIIAQSSAARVQPDIELPQAASRPSVPCSDITGTSNGNGSRSSNCATRKPGFYCVAGGDCLAAAKWTLAEPYNHGPAPMRFHPFRGGEVIIEAGQSLWSIPDDGVADTHRRLEARPWGGEPRGVQLCAVEYTNAKIRTFQVGIDCEINRQTRLQTEFESREDDLPYIDAKQCKGKIKMTAGWENFSIDYWKDNPSIPVGVCETPDAHDSSHTDSHPIREPHWLPAKKCTELGEILGQTPVITVNKRGVRGCRFKGE